MREAVDKLRKHDEYSELREIRWDLADRGCLHRADGNKAET